MATLSIKFGRVTANSVEGTQIAEGLYRLEQEASWWLAADSVEETESYPSYGDIFRAVALGPAAIECERVHERAPLKHHSFIVPASLVSSPAFEKSLGAVDRAGGHWERVMGGILLVSIPSESDFDPSREIGELVSETPPEDAALDRR
jgi:hypothetical protein